MDMLNIYSQRLGKSMPPRMATRLQAPVTESIASQTELSCPPAKNVSLQTKMRLKTSASQTDHYPPPRPPVSLAAATTQTDIVDSPKNDNVRVSNTPQAVRGGPKRSKPVGVITTTDSPQSSRAESPSKASSVVSSGEKTVSVDMEEQKKRELLATLKAMDAQKDPPASQPIASTAVRSTAQPTSNATVGEERSTIAAKLTKQSTQTQKSQPAKVDAPSGEEEEAKKKLLLAKLMAIDKGSDPDKVTMSKVDVSKTQPSPKRSASSHKSTTSIQSWSETVENMHHGKPAFATDDDPFGSRHSSGKKGISTRSRDFFITEGGGGGGDGPKSKRPGHRHQLEQKSSSHFDTARKNSKEQDSPPTEAPAAVQLGYQPTFGRRAGAMAASQKPKNGMIFGDFDNLPQLTAPKKTEPPSSLLFNYGNGVSKHDHDTTSSSKDYPWETRVNVSSNPPQGAGSERHTERGINKGDAGPLSSPSMVFGYVGQPKPLHALQSRSRGSLLPLREKAASSVMMPGTVDVTEPDDLEELAL